MVSASVLTAFTFDPLSKAPASLVWNVSFVPDGSVAGAYQAAEPLKTVRWSHNPRHRTADGPPNVTNTCTWAVVEVPFFCTNCETNRLASVASSASCGMCPRSTCGLCGPSSSAAISHTSSWVQRLCLFLPTSVLLPSLTHLLSLALTLPDLLENR